MAKKKSTSIPLKAKNIIVEPIEKLVEDPKNENTHSDIQIEALSKIIKINGFRSPIIVSNRTGLIVSGHGRLQAARLLGMTELPVIYQDFKNEADEIRHRLADNEISRHSALDVDKMIENLKELDFDLESLDFSELGLINFDFSDLDKANQINIGDENSEWVGMPTFEKDENGYVKLIYHFKTEIERELFVKEKSLHIDKKMGSSWIVYP